MPTFNLLERNQTKLLVYDVKCNISASTNPKELDSKQCRFAAVDLWKIQRNVKKACHIRKEAVE